MTTSAPTRPGARRPSAVRRILGLARANTLLLVRNRMTLLYAVAFPLLPILMVLAGGGSADPGGGTALTTSLTIAFLFPIYYNILSMVVTRRDELVLKRLRTGEATDAEILIALCLPGVVITMLLAIVLIPIGLVAGLQAPANPVLYLVAVLCGSATYVGLALWTAAWTRNAEAAQLTSLPVMVLAIVGQFADLMPSIPAMIAERTPGAALLRLVDATWLGLDGDRALGFAETWAAAAPRLLVLLAWAALGMWLARRSMRWEPRT